LKHTPEDYPDYASISRACDEMLRVGSEVNEKKREYEESERQCAGDEADVKVIQSLSSSIKLMELPGNSKLTDFGRLRKAGDAVVYTDRGKAADYVFVLDVRSN